MAQAQAPFFTESYVSNLDDLLIEVCEELQLSEYKYGLAEDRYTAIGKVLESEGSPFTTYRPHIYPQGSMRLNTTVKPIVGPHDLDFVLELTVSHELVDPMRLIQSLFRFLSSHGTYKGMTTLKNRCVRVEYADDFYMDILPACTNVAGGPTWIKVPDRAVKDWKDSDPIGYANWFEVRSRYLLRERSVLAKADPIPDQQAVGEKNALQLTVQLIKRWRDLHYADNSDHAPISIVLTTLAADCYSGQVSVSEALTGVLDGIVARIEAAAAQLDRVRVLNPSNPAEDLSERWDDDNSAYLGFVEGMYDFRDRWRALLKKGKRVTADLEQLFGETVKTAVEKQARRLQERRTTTGVGVSSTGRIAAVSVLAPAVPRNTFYGQE